MNDIEKYLLELYPKSTHKKLYYKFYYQRHKKKLLDYNNERYDQRLTKGNTKINKGDFTISFK